MMRTHFCTLTAQKQGGGQGAGNGGASPIIRALRAPPWTDESTPWKEANEQAGGPIGATLGAPGAPSQGQDGQAGGIPDRGMQDGGMCDGGIQDRGIQDGQDGGSPSTSPTPADGGSPSTSASATPPPSQPPPPPPLHPPPPDGGSASTSATAAPSHPPPAPPRRDSGQKRSDTDAHAASPSTSCKPEAGRETTLRRAETTLGRAETTLLTTHLTTHLTTNEASRREAAEGPEKTSEREQTHEYQTAGQEAGQEKTNEPLAHACAPQTRREVEHCEEAGKEGDKTASHTDKTESHTEFNAVSNTEIKAVSVNTEVNAVSNTESKAALKTELATFVPRVCRVVKRWPWEEELGVVRARPSVVTWYVSERASSVSHVPAAVSVSMYRIRIGARAR